MKKLRPVPTVAVVAVCALLAAALGFASRESTQDEPILSTHPTDAVLTVGVVADLGSPQGREVVRGLRLWQAQLEPTSGIPYQAGKAAAVKLTIEDDHGSASTAHTAATRLVAGGATVLFGPPDPAQLDQVARVAVRKGALLLSSVPKPLTVPRAPTSFFLSAPPAGSPAPIYDALDAARKAHHRGRNSSTRVAIVAMPGIYGTEATGAENLANLRAYRVHRERIGGSTTPAVAFAAARRFRPDLIYVLAPVADVYSWIARYGRKSDPPWASYVPDFRQALGRSSQPLAFSVPWSPLNQSGGPVFPARTFASEYLDVYNTAPSTAAAASAATGIALSQAVAMARSTDTARLAEALGAIQTPSLWGTLQFIGGVQRKVPGAALVVTGRRLVAIGSAPGQWEVLAKSIPNGTPPGPTAPPATTAVVPTTPGTTTTGTTTTPAP